MAQFLLIHGASHGAWCWRDVIPALADRGHEARAIDLPGHGEDTTPRQGVTLQSYVDAITATLRETGQPTIVVAHSMSGVPATQAADLHPELFARLVYLCAFLPGDGDSVTSLSRAWPDQPLNEAIRRDEGRVTFHFDPAMIREKFYHDCPEALVNRAARHLTPQPILTQKQPVTLTGRVEQVPRSYIVCAQDVAVPPDHQRSMASVLPREDVYDMSSAHSPFLSDPDGLAALLDLIARS
ncbi:alpha/beta fold hydrolase [Alloyangia pacifica]|uniref:alpha/beta fold hydrolase n=1 Tax=Alloyangia pacifica TaxID=311180 RepID=UPI001CD42E5E|nr:alpha/beta fold hydrolase [Alloyangia pacifica]MCA0997867.1 alpha/beta fold hydrolase [Alloyangia pacifica]